MVATPGQLAAAARLMFGGSLGANSIKWTRLVALTTCACRLAIAWKPLLEIAWVNTAFASTTSTACASSGQTMAQTRWRSAITILGDGEELV